MLWLTESFVALRALVRALLRVHSQMLTKVVLRSEAFVALGTVERSLSRVNSFVNCASSGCGKSRTALTASEDGFR